MITTQERDYLNENFPGWLDFSDEDLYQATARMTSDLDYQRARKVRDDTRTTDAVFSNTRKDDYWPIWFPRDKNAKPIMIQVGDGQPEGKYVYDKPVFREHHVAIPEALLPVFCDRFGLDYSQMLNMLSGNAQEYKGFRRWNGKNLAANKWSSIPGRALGSPPPRIYTQEQLDEMQGREPKKSYLDRKPKEKATVYFHDEPVEVWRG